MIGTDVLRIGGKWLGSVRSWLQWHKQNGSKVTWGSDDVLEPPMTVRDCETLAAEAVTEERERCAKMMLDVCGHSIHGIACTWCLMAKQIREGK